MRVATRWLFSISALLLTSAGSLSGATTVSVTQSGITWTFDKPYEVGQFANGDWWVLGPVQITAMTPQFTGQRNGWQVNPTDTVHQGYDDRAPDFDARLVPSLPYVARGGQSIIKTVSLRAEGNRKTCLQSAAVLTVVESIPPEHGRSVFRPPYAGTNKPYYLVTHLRTDLLPTLAPTAHAPSLASVEKRFKPLQLDHKVGWSGDQIHPIDNMPDYGATLGRDTGEALLRLCCDDPLPAKMPALIAYVQNGIDLFHLHQLGLRWCADGGHGNGRKLPMAFAAVMLDHQTMKETVMKAAQTYPNDAGVFGEDGHLYTGVNGVVLFGKRDRWWSEKAYWHNFVSISSKDYRDPYGCIDGGHQQEGAYQVCCTSFMWKGTALALWLIPELKRVWNNDLFTTYVDRYVTQGRIYAPDPSAPYDGNWDHYGKTFGPDGKGGFIKGAGRMPSWNGLNKDEGYYGSAFANEMWTRYRAMLPQHQR